jgi:4,4'-diaponeurosporenoate glycosyltransferase
VSPAADTVAFAALWLVGWWLLWRLRVPPTAETGARPPVSIVVPARDEEATLPVLLGSLRDELTGDDEIVVVDDASTDATAAVARAGGARVVPAADLPPGWSGKSAACALGADEAACDVLVFLDADTRLEPGGLDRVVAGHGGVPGAGLYSVQPWHEVRRPYEHLAALFNLVAVMGSGAFTPVGDRGRSPVAFGPCLVTSVEDYDRAGGHAAVVDRPVDDVALARAYRAAGLPVRIRGGRGVIRFRMYPAGLGQLVEGFTKNMALGATAIRPVALLAVAGWLAACAAPLVLAAAEPAAGAGAYLAVVGQLRVQLRRVGSFGILTALAYPALLAVFVAVLLRSAVLASVLRRVRWKGRDLRTRP